MRWLRATLVRFVSMFQGARLDRELAAELESHLAMHIEDNLRAGMTAAEARRQAHLKLGGVAQVTERYRARRGLPLLENLIRDLGFGARMLRRNPGFTAVAVLTLALGIGANTAIFSVVNAVILRPLPFPGASRLVLLWATNRETGDTDDVSTYPDFADWRAHSRSFERMAAFTTRGMTIAGDEQTERVQAVQATPGFFETLGVAPALGRTFRPDEGETGAAPVAVLSDSAWKRFFGTRADILGKTIRADETAYTIVGVMAPDFRFSLSPGPPEQIYVPLAPDPNRHHGFLRVLGRLRPDVQIPAAQAEMDVVTGGLAKQYPDTNQNTGSRIVPLAEALVGRLRTGLTILLGVVSLVLLIACTNVASLLLARSAARQKELALRAALGAGRARLLQQMITESTLLSVAGGALGLLLASWSAHLLAQLLARNFEVPRIESTGTDGWVLGFTLILSLVTGIVFGAVFTPITASSNLDRTLRESSRTATGGVRGRRLRGALVVIETALALVLLAGAGLLLKHFWTLRTTAPGFEPENLLTAGMWLPESVLAKEPARRRFCEELLARAEALPGARSAALVADLPLGNGWDSLGFHIPGRPDPAPDSAFSADFNIASPGYFRTMGIPLRSGREFTRQDSAEAPGVIVVNETAARRFWPGEDPVGKVINLPDGDGTGADRPLTVVGVAGDVRQRGLGSEPQPEIFLDDLQPSPAWPWLVLVVRTGAEPSALAGAVKDLVRSVDRDVPVSEVRTLDEVLAASVAEPRIYTLLIGLFAALALTLAAVGLYGVVSYTVAQRTPEMGIRLALGAGRSGVVRLVLRHGLGLALTGTAIGLAVSLAVARLFTRWIPEARPVDPLTLAAVVALLLGVALAATWVPARRASRVDPTVALRWD
jgi:putative ABC transport system permease protein